MAEDVNCVMVASIDFGTTFSGYTCSLKGQEIKINKNWGDSQGHQVISLPRKWILISNKHFNGRCQLYHKLITIR